MIDIYHQTYDIYSGRTPKTKLDRQRTLDEWRRASTVLTWGTKVNLTFNKVIFMCDIETISNDSTLEPIPQTLSVLWCESTRWRLHWSSLSAIGPAGPAESRYRLETSLFGAYNLTNGIKESILEKRLENWHHHGENSARSVSSGL